MILHKSNTYALKDFEEARMNSMIAIVTHYPKEGADYLTSQFYEPGYSLTQRTDILNVWISEFIFKSILRKLYNVGFGNECPKTKQSK